jgi:hypothetical protein
MGKRAIDQFLQVFKMKVVQTILETAHRINLIIFFFIKEKEIKPKVCD